MKKLLFLTILCLTVALSGCVDNHSGDCGSIYDGPTKRTLLIYMAANNNLSPEAVSNINSIRSAATKYMLDRNKVVIYYAKPGATPQLLELVYNNTLEAAEYSVLKDYGSQSAADTASYGQAIRDMKSFAPADSYALVLWSHATGWFPVNTPTRFLRLDQSLNRMSSLDAQHLIRDPFRTITWLETKAFGQDGGNWLELASLAAATPADTFDFIIADCCLMGQAEVAYAFRKKTDYLIVSPAEVVSTGMPYGDILDDVFAEKELVPALKNICYEYNRYYQYWLNPSGGYGAERNSATIALYDCSQIEALSNAMAVVVNSVMGQIPTMNVAGIQRYDRYTLSTSYDVRGFVETLLPENDPFRLALEEQLDRTVIYKATTGRMINLVIDKDKYSGMSMYIPLADYDDLNTYYYQTAWGKKIFDLE